ncbi:endo-1,4-beta-xylanase [Chamaesiphon sp. OTE_20_metabat_361]|uniref:endo-1,4-beta-xylanase n=1 Tax=Chamaesiphon sp. OTE_20_metabat_361 TaxID=2964689 RepID=UPI00286B5174|nr:endo-1,4-beta-xylanase [Chamaesiphon sp. OTE_20_metabat_361]
MLKFGRYLLLGLIVTTLWVSQGQSMSIFFAKAPTPLSFIQANQLKLAKQIAQTRMGNIVIEVVNSQQQPIGGVEVKIEQVTHEFEFGTALSTQMFAPGNDPTDRSRYLQLAKQLFNATVHENALKWDAMEPQRGQLSYADADRILSWSKANSLPLRGHTIFWEVEQWNPTWLKSLSPQDLRSAVERRATEICGRYRGRIREYDVLNEMLHGDFFRQRLGADIVKTMFQRCHAADPSAVLYVNDYDILNGKRLDDYVRQIRSLLAQGVPVGGIGIQAHILKETVAPAQIQHSLDTLAQFNLPIKITEFSTQTATEQEQAQNLLNVYQIAFAHPQVKGILMWGFWEKAHWVPQAAIFDSSFRPKLAAKVYQELIFRQWWTQKSGNTNRNGQFSNRAFFGRYRVTVKGRNWSRTRLFSFSSQMNQSRVLKFIK